MLLLASAICFVYVIVQSGIVFSSKKSEGSMSIDENELKELYRKFVLNYCDADKSIRKFIFVIEDLDRTDKHDCVITFLKELRKYYTLGNNNGEQKNKIVFVVNVKTETSLCQGAKKYKMEENESLYAKLFDFILNLQTINIPTMRPSVPSREQTLQKTPSSSLPPTSIMPVPTEEYQLLVSSKRWENNCWSV